MTKFNATIIYLLILIKFSHQFYGPIIPLLPNNTVKPNAQKTVCELLIVELFERFYTVNTENDILLINCNAYFADLKNSRCNDESVYNIRFDLIVDGNTLVHEYMKRRDISNSGFIAKFQVNAKMLINRSVISPNNPFKSNVICRATVSTDLKTVINQSLESYLVFNTDADKTFTNSNKISTKQSFTTERYIYSNDSRLTSNQTNSCGSLLVNILRKNYILDANNAIKTPINISCIAMFRANKNRSKLCPTNGYKAYAAIEIDGRIDEWKHMNIHYNYSTEYFSDNFKSSAKPNFFDATFEKNFSYFNYMNGVYQTRCHVSLVSMESITTNQSIVSSIIVRLNKNVSSLYESCSASLPCDKKQNLMCGANRLCSCRYNFMLKQYYIPYKTGDAIDWSCITPVRYNEHCIADVQCNTVTVNTICAKLSIGKVCVCNQNYYWNGNKCVFYDSITKSSNDDAFTSMEIITPRYDYIATYRVNAAKVVVVSFGAIFVGYVVIAAVLHVFSRKQKMQYRINRNFNNRLHRKYDPRKFIPHVYITEQINEEKKEIVIKEHIIEDAKNIA